MQKQSLELSDLQGKIDNDPNQNNTNALIEFIQNHEIQPDVQIKVYATLVSPPVIEYTKASVFQSLEGVGFLLSCITLKSDPLLVSLLQSALECNGLVKTLFQESQSETTSLFCGSRILNITSQSSLENWVCSPKSYVSWLSMQLLSFPQIPTVLLSRAFGLGHQQVLVKSLFSGFEQFCASFKQLRASQKSFILRTALLPYFIQCRPDPVYAAIILAQFGLDVAQIASIASEQLDRYAVQVLGLAVSQNELVSLLRSQVSLWGDTFSQSAQNTLRHEMHTRFLLVLAQRLSVGDALEISRSTDYLEAISSHLGALEESTRLVGVVFGEAIASAAQSPMDFGVPYDKTEWIPEQTCVEDTSLEHALGALNQTNDPEVGVPEFGDNAPADGDSDDASADSDDADSDSDEPSAPAPVYLKDLVLYLSSDNRAKIESGLRAGASLVSRKSHYGTEVEDYADGLVRTAIGLGDKFNIKDFSKMQQTLLVAVIVAVPSRAQLVCQLFVQGDYSIYQRTTLLSILAVASYQLSTGTAPKAEFKRLPGEAHAAFSSQLDHLVASTKELLLQPEESELSGRVVRRSKRLDLKTKPTQTINQFSKIAARLFFFPLVAAYTCAQTRTMGGSYAPLLHGQILQTLGLILFYAYPTNDIQLMSSELLRILNARIINSHECFTEPIFTCLAALLDTAAGLLPKDQLFGLYVWARDHYKADHAKVIHKLDVLVRQTSV